MSEQKITLKTAAAGPEAGDLGGEGPAVAPLITVPLAACCGEVLAGEDCGCAALAAELAAVGFGGAR